MQRPMRDITRDIWREMPYLHVTLGVTLGRDIEPESVTSAVTPAVTLGVTSPSTYARAPLLRRGCHVVTASVTRDVTCIHPCHGRCDIKAVTCSRDIPAQGGDITPAGVAQVLKGERP